jgi:hypothetical protein
MVPNEQLQSYLDINVVEDDRAYALSRKHKVIRRYCAGLQQVISNMPELQELVLDMGGARQLIVNTRTLLDRSLYESAAKSNRAAVFKDLDKEQVDIAKSFYKQMKSTRGSLGTSNETIQALSMLVPSDYTKSGDSIPVVLNRHQALWLCAHAMENPDFRLNEEGKAFMDAAEITRKTSEPAARRQSGPRL